MTAAEILRELVAIPTPSAVSNVPLIAWVAAFLAPRGWRTEELPYGDDAGVAKANFIAWRGVEERPEFFELAFVCHTDTVPYAVDWAGALTIEERGEALHGCGACDVKGALACFLAAVDETAKTHLNHRKNGGAKVGLILTADEEIGCKGMERLLLAANLRIGSAIVSEPTSLRAGIAGKGYGLAQVTVEGREAHSAFPRQGVSAIAAAARLICRIENEFGSQASASEGNSLFDPPHTTVNIGVIEGGTAKNIVPGNCRFLVEWRAIPGEEPAWVLERLRSLASAEGGAGLELHVEGLRAEWGFAPAFDSARGWLRARLTETLGDAPIGISFGSEASRLARIAEEVIVIGPGDMRTAHSNRECVPAAELERWTGVLATLIAG